MLSSLRVVVLNLKSRSSGVSTSIFALQPKLESLDDSVCYLGAKFDGKSRRITFWQLLQLCFTYIKLPLVIHARRDHEILLALMLRFFSPRKIKIIFTFAGQRPKGKFSSMLCGQVDYIIATSSQSAKFAPFVSKIVGHGVNIPDLQTCAPRSANAVRRIAIIGRIRAEKGADIFVDALLGNLHHAFEAYIIGAVVGRNQIFQRQLQEKIASYNAEDRFIWQEMSYPAVMEFLQSVDIVVACPRYERFGLTLYEGAAAGCALIGSDTGAFPELIGENQRGILIPCNDVNALQLAIDQLLSNKQIMADKAIAAASYVKEYCSLDNEAAALAKIYKQYLV